MLYVTILINGYRRTKRSKYTPPLLPGTPPAETPSIRGAARSPARGPSRRRSGARLRLLPQFLPRPLSPFSQRNPPHLFSLSAARPSDPTQEVSSSRPDH